MNEFLLGHFNLLLRDSQEIPCKVLMNEFLLGHFNIEKQDSSIEVKCFNERIPFRSLQQTKPVRCNKYELF